MSMRTSDAVAISIVICAARSPQECNEGAQTGNADNGRNQGLAARVGARCFGEAVLVSPVESAVG